MCKASSNKRRVIVYLVTSNPDTDLIRMHFMEPEREEEDWGGQKIKRM
jgi:hypothetical protein